MGTPSERSVHTVPPITFRKVRILAVHSAPSNSNVMKFQTVQLRKTIGQDAEWLFADSPNSWVPRALPGAKEGDPPDVIWELYGAERSDIEKRLAGSKPFLEWLRFEKERNTPTPESVVSSYEYLLKQLETESPIDVVVAHSQGTAIIGGLIEKLKSTGREIPWRLSIFFCPVPPLAVPPLTPWDHKIVAVLGGEKDPFYVSSKAALLGRYTQVTILEHDDGHAFPFAEPLASQVYTKCANAVRGLMG